MVVSDCRTWPFWFFRQLISCWLRRWHSFQLYILPHISYFLCYLCHIPPPECVHCCVFAFTGLVVVLSSIPRPRTALARASSALRIVPISCVTVSPSRMHRHCRDTPQSRCIVMSKNQSEYVTKWRVCHICTACHFKTPVAFSRSRLTPGIRQCFDARNSRKHIL